MMKYLAMAFLGLTMLSGAHRISSIERNGSWIYLYDESGKKYQTLNASQVGEILGYSSTFFVSRNASWIYLWDAEGKKINTRTAR